LGIIEKGLDRFGKVVWLKSIKIYDFFFLGANLWPKKRQICRYFWPKEVKTRIRLQPPRTL